MLLNTDVTVLLGLWMVSFAGFLTVSMLRARVGRHEDDYLHVLDSDAHKVDGQALVARKMQSLDRWRTALLALVILFGAVIAGLQVYGAWVRGISPNV
jgi:hypothetical protein